tara:strand:- start:34 stop:420 length:387 start_codon:yes stop_codon:yes gene_type:complete
MILPGISGAYILIILGTYEFLIDKISNLFIDMYSVKIVCIFGFGFLIGIIFFSKFIKYLLLNFKKSTFVTLIGLIVGSLPKVLPIELSYDSSFFESLTEFFYKNPSSIFFILIGITCVFIFSEFKIKI